MQTKTSDFKTEKLRFVVGCEMQTPASLQKTWEVLSKMITTMNDKISKENQKEIPGRDRLFERADYSGPFEFNEAVVQVFDDMISRSVPLYREVTESTVYMTAANYVEGTNIVDVGCSTGNTLQAIARVMKDSATLVGLDTSQPMLEKAKEKLEAFVGLHKIKLSNEDALAFDYHNSSVVILNYTLQFIPVAKRLMLLKRIYSGLVPQGIIIVSDKVTSSNTHFMKLQTCLYEGFKAKNGYSRTEIERKKAALDNVLIPLTWKKQLELITSAGFSTVEPMIKWNNFMSVIAQKG